MDNTRTQNTQTPVQNEWPDSLRKCRHHLRLIFPSISLLKSVLSRICDIGNYYILNDWDEHIWILLWPLHIPKSKANFTECAASPFPCKDASQMNLQSLKYKHHLMIPWLPPSSDSLQHFHYCPVQQQIMLQTLLTALQHPIWRRDKYNMP